MAHHYELCPQLIDNPFSNHPSEPRRNSGSSSSSNDSTIHQSFPSPKPFSQRRSIIHTRPVPLGGAGVFFEREPLEPHDDDILLVTVKLSAKRQSESFNSENELPVRPPRRNFFKRMSTRWTNCSIDFKQYKTLRMPRREYLKFFAKDRLMNYIGTEPEREWDEEELMRRYAEFQHLPLFAIAC